MKIGNFRVIYGDERFTIKSKPAYTMVDAVTRRMKIMFKRKREDKNEHRVY